MTVTPDSLQKSCTPLGKQPALTWSSSLRWTDASSGLDSGRVLRLLLSHRRAVAIWRVS